MLDYESTSAAGVCLADLKKSLQNQCSGLRPNDFPHSNLATWIGRVTQLDEFIWPADRSEWQSRNNALAAIGLEQGSLPISLAKIMAIYPAHRLGIVMGSSTSSIDRTEQAYREQPGEAPLAAPFCQPLVHNPHGPGLYVAAHTGITGPVVTINTACSSSAKVFATGARWLACGLVDAVLVGGVDSLCLSVLHGFHSLQLISQYPCRPFDQNRDGINLGEAAGFAILARSDLPDLPATIRLCGYGESSDAHHMSHPHPEGLGARLAMTSALEVANLEPADIDYINLHGTASRANDLIEGKLIAAMFGNNTAISSTKGWTGHTLGAAGITEAIIAMETLRNGLIPGCLNLQTLDQDLDLTISAANLQQPVRHAMSNSFGFGGNNCSLIFSKVNS